MSDPPTVAERQRVERLIAAVMAGLDPQQAVGQRRDGSARHHDGCDELSEASEKVDPDEDIDPTYRRYLALSDLFDAMATLASADRPEGR